MKQQKLVEHQHYPMGNIRRQERREERPKRQKRRKRYGLDAADMGGFRKRHHPSGGGGLPAGQAENPVIS
jgi:hypothetical protein